MDSFDTFSPAALEFLKSLQANNTKEWFAANKKAYEDTLKGPSAQFASDMAHALGGLTGQRHSSKIFRIYRDVRFSKDKTPYNAHLHIAFTPESKIPQPPMWFFGVSPDKLSLGCGVFQYQKQALEKYREAMSGPLGADLIEIGAELCAQGLRIGEPELKRTPPGIAQDHQNSEALRRKGLVVWNEKNAPSFAVEPNLVRRSVAEFEKLKPVYQLLSQIT